MTASTTSGSLRAAAAMTLLGCSTGVTATLTHYPVLGGQAARYLLAAALLLPLARHGGRLTPRLSARELGRIVLLAATGLFAFNLLLIAALRRTDPAGVGSVVGCTPLLLAVLGPLLARRRPQARLVLCAVVVVAGAAVTQGFGSGSAAGFGFALGTLACEAAFSLVAVPLLERLGPVRVSAYATVVAAAMFALTGALLGGGALPRPPRAAELGALLYLATLLTAGAFLLWYAALARLGPERAGLFAGLIPVTAALSGAAFAGAPLRPGELAGTVLVGAGVAFGLPGGVVRQRRQERAELGGPSRCERPLGNRQDQHLALVEQEELRSLGELQVAVPGRRARAAGPAEEGPLLVEDGVHRSGRAPQRPRDVALDLHGELEQQHQAGGQGDAGDEARAERELGQAHGDDQDRQAAPDGQPGP